MRIRKRERGRVASRQAVPTSKAALPALAVAAALGAAGAPVAQAADACPNADVRAQQGSSGLPGCRAYEQVSPAEKFGFSVGFGNRRFQGTPITATTRDGEVAMYTSYGSFAGSTHSVVQPYRSVRTEQGWATAPASLPPTVASPNILVGHGMGTWFTATPSLSAGLSLTDNGWVPNDDNEAKDIYLVPADPAGTTLVTEDADGAPLGEGSGDSLVGNVEGLSDDARHVVFQTTASLSPEDTVPGSPDVYERIDGGSPRLVSHHSAAHPDPTCGASLATMTFGGSSTDTSNGSTISADGDRIVFQTPQSAGYWCSDASNVTRLWLRIDGDQTREISASRRTVPDPLPPSGSRLVGMSDAGDRVVFLSSDALTDDATSDPGNSKLYLYDVEADTLTLLLDGSASPTTVAFSPDLSRVLFTTNVKLTPEATQDVNNLYSIDTSTRDVTWLASAAAGSGVLSISSGGISILPGTDGESTLFLSNADLGFNSGGRDQVYLARDGQPTVCVSCPPAGVVPRGDALISEGSAGGFYASRQTYGSSLSADGSRVAFQTNDGLNPTDTNNRDDIYLWDDGELSLVTSGQARTNAEIVGMSADGEDVFFVTAESLIPQDADVGASDLYDARVGGGFLAPAAAQPAAPCSGDACQDSPRGAPPAAGDPASGSERTGGNASATPRPKLAVGRVTAAQRRTAGRTGRLALKARVNRPGTISASATARLGGRMRTVASSRTRARTRGTYAVTLRLSSAARRQLARTGRLTVNAVVRFSGATEPSRYTIKLLAPAARRATVPASDTRKAR